MTKKGMNTHFLKHYPFLGLSCHMKKQRLFDIRHKKTCNVLILQVLQ